MTARRACENHCSAVLDSFAEALDKLAPQETQILVEELAKEDDDRPGRVAVF